MTIEELLDREALKDLRLAYAAHFDRQELDRLMELFTEDAVCAFGPAYGGDWVGRDAIRANYAAAMQAIGAPMAAMHIVTNPWIELTGPDTARARWYLLDFLTRQAPHNALVTPGGHANPLLYLAVYEDECRKADDRWRIARTELHFLWPDRE
jgi:hypothetical protein